MNNTALYQSTPDAAMALNHFSGSKPCRHWLDFTAFSRMQNMFREHKKAQTDENTETTNNKVTHICRKVIQNCGFERSREVSGLQTWNWALTPDTTPSPNGTGNSTCACKWTPTDPPEDWDLKPETLAPHNPKVTKGTEFKKRQQRPSVTSLCQTSTSLLSRVS